MTYYWCELIFDENGNITRRNSLDSCDDESLIPQMLSKFVYKHGFARDTTEQALRRMEQAQNLTGTDCTRVVERTRYDPVADVIYDADVKYYLNDRQFVAVERGKIHVLDIRQYHDAVIRYFEQNTYSGNHIRYVKSRRCKRQGRSHKHGGHWHWQSNIKCNYRYISQSMTRKKYASDFCSDVTFDPKFHQTENNWKETKCRHQWEWHKKKHQDRAYCPDASETEDLIELYEYEKE